MKTILIPAEDHDAMPAVLEMARLVARRFNSYIEGFALHPGAADFVAVDPLSSLTIPQVQDSSAEIERNARGLFESFMAANDVPFVTLPPSDRQQEATYSCGWTRSGPEPDAFVGTYGRLFDLIILGRPGREPQNPRMAPLEAALFDSGHPVLIVPSVPDAPVPPVLGRNILVAWNGSTEQSRTNAFAMALLRGAEQVTVLSVEGGMTPGPAGDDAARHLRRNGVSAKAVTVGLGSRTTGEVILDQAQSLGCDLLIKGAYTQSRFRQMIFGGSTRHILANATLPILMAH